MCIGIALARDAEIQQLYDDYVNWKMTKVDPQNGQISGFLDSSTEPKLNNFTLDFLRAINESCANYSNRASAFLQDEKTPTLEKKFLRLLKYEADTCVEGYKHKGYLLAPVSFMDGVQIALPKFFGSGNQLVYKSLDHYENNLKAMAKIPTQLEEIQKLLQLGVKEKMTHARESILAVEHSAKTQFEAIQVEDPGKSEFYKQFISSTIQENIPGIDASRVGDLQNRARQVISNVVLPAFKRLQDYIFGEYKDNLRPAAGIHSVPNGHEYYQTCIDYFTSLKGVTPDEIHQIGMDEIETLKKGAQRSAVMLGMGHLNFTEIANKLRNDKDNKFDNETLAFAFVHQRFKDINGHLGKIFSDDILQNYTYECDIKQIPAGEGGLAYYQTASLDGSRNGSFHLNWKLLTRTETTALVLHETNPGHHLQLSTILNNKDVPAFISLPSYFLNPSNPGVYIGYAEGWGLYSEFLGQQMGVYDEDNQILGYYSLNLLRASRLVVDTGIHAFNWTREEAIDFLMKNTFALESTIISQVDRYIGWPGQALAYKMGDMKIREVRNKLEKKDGFTIKKFHDGVLSCMGPLNDLECCVNKTVIGKQGASCNKATITAGTSITIIFLVIMSVMQ